MLHALYFHYTYFIIYSKSKQTLATDERLWLLGSTPPAETPPPPDVSSCLMVGSVNICMGFSIKDPRFNALSPPIKKRKWIKTRLHYIHPYSSSFSTVQVYINSEFPVLTDSIKSLSEECRQEAKEEILI